MSSKGWTPACRRGEILPGGHRIVVDGTPGKLRTQTWRCCCGRWNATVPAAAADGNTSPEARIAAVRAAHREHVREAATQLAGSAA